MFSPIFKEFILPVGSLLVAIVSFFSMATSIPIWAKIVLVSFIAIAGFVLLIPFFRYMGSKCIKYKEEKNLGEEFYPDMRDCINNLVKELELNRTDNVVGVIRDLSGKGILSDMSQLIEQTDRIINWVCITKKLFENPRSKDISLLAQAINTAVFQYNAMCIHAEEDLEKLRKDVIKNSDHVVRKDWSDLKKRWEVAKDNQRGFIRSWENVIRRLNVKNQERNFLFITLIESFGPIHSLGDLID